MNDYFTTRLNMITEVGVTVDTTDPHAAMTTLSKNPLGKLMLEQVEKILTAERQVLDAIGLMERTGADTRTLIASGRDIYDSMASAGRDFDLAARTRANARESLAALAGAWIETHKADHVG